jgi:thioredoxin 1
MSAVLEITDSQFEAEVVQADQPVLAYFWAPWCGPCRLVAPSVASLAAAYGDRLKVVKLEIDPNPETVGQYKVEAVPALMLFHKGEVVDRVEGAVGKQRIEQMITSHLEGAP